MYDIYQRAVGCSPFKERGPTAKQAGGESQPLRTALRALFDSCAKQIMAFVRLAVIPIVIEIIG